MNPFLSQLATLVSEQTARAKWIFVPSAALGHTLGERLLHEGVAWANLRFATPFEIALQAAAPFLLEQGLNPKPEELGPALMHQLLDSLPPSTPAYFRPLADQPGMAESLYYSLHEFRMTGLEIDDLQRLPATPKRAELVALLQAYERYLRHNQLADRALVFRTAMAHSQLVQVQAGDLVLEYPWLRLHPLERRFLDGLAGEKRPCAVPSLPTLRRQPLLNPRQTPVAIQPAYDCELLAYLGRPAPPPADDGTLKLFVAGRRDAEIHEVLRRLLSTGVPLDQAEIALADPESLSLLQDKLAGLNLPATFEDGVPLLFSRPGQALTGLLSWLEHSISAFDLRRLVLTGAVAAPPGAARLLEQSGATWGRDTYGRSFTSLRQRLSSHPDQLEQVEAVAAWVEILLQKLPSPGPVAWSVWLQCFQVTLETLVQPQSAEDASAFAQLRRALRQLELLPDQVRQPEQWLQLLRSRLQPLRFGASRPMPGRLHVCALERVGTSGRQHVFILGLEEGRLLPRETQDPVFSDTERQLLHPALALASDKAAEQSAAVQASLSTLSGQVTLSHSARDLRSGQELLPALVFFQAARLLQPSVATYDALAKTLGEPLSWAAEDPRHTLHDAEFWLATRATEVRVLQHYPDLRSGQAAELARQSREFTSYDGFVPEAAGKIRSQPFSITGLQKLAGCPFRYFLEYGLGVRPLELVRPQHDRWLDPAARGTCLHEVFAAYYRCLREESQAPDLQRDEPLLLALLHEELERWRLALPPVSLACEEREVRDLQRAVRHFLRLESRRPGRTPVGLEVGFGFDEPSDEPLARSEAVIVDLGDGVTLQLRGRIDRIDDVENALEVIDYKTGYRLCENRNARYQGGRLLQHALYALVVEQLTGRPVRRSAYYFPSPHAQREWIAFSRPDVPRLREVVRHVLMPLESGSYVLSDNQKVDCTYCELAAACRNQQREAAVKVANESNGTLQCRRELADVE